MYDVVIIGGGPGGYGAALYAHNFGLNVALVEKQRIGGTCLLRGCIPAKTWLQAADVFTTIKRSEEFGISSSAPVIDWRAALQRKNQVVDGLVKGLGGLLKARGADVVDGYGRVVDGGVEVTYADGSRQRLEARNIVLATGSVPASIPGYDFDGTQIVSSDEALDWESQPDSVAIIGAGAIGCEFASFLGDMGSSVHLFEMFDQVLPGMEPEAAKVLDRAFRKKGVKVHTGVAVRPPTRTPDAVSVPYGENTAVDVDVVLVAVGRAPVTGDLGLEENGIMTDVGYVIADLETMQTSREGVYAVGDIVAGTPQLAHVGFAEAIAAITHIATGEVAPVNYRAIPMIVYTNPEVAAVGLTEQQALERGYEVAVATHGMRGVGRAIIHGETGGIVKLVSEEGGPILGATVADPVAGELIHEMMFAVGWEALPEEAASFIHAHPTVSEAIGETLLTAAGRSLH